MVPYRVLSLTIALALGALFMVWVAHGIRGPLEILGPPGFDPDAADGSFYLLLGQERSMIGPPRSGAQTFQDYRLVGLDPSGLRLTLERELESSRSGLNPPTLLGHSRENWWVWNQRLEPFSREGLTPRTIPEAVLRQMPALSAATPLDPRQLKPSVELGGLVMRLGGKGLWLLSDDLTSLRPLAPSELTAISPAEGQARSTGLGRIPIAGIGMSVVDPALLAVDGQVLGPWWYGLLSDAEAAELRSAKGIRQVPQQRVPRTRAQRRLYRARGGYGGFGGLEIEPDTLERLGGYSAPAAGLLRDPARAPTLQHISLSLGDFAWVLSDPPGFILFSATDKERILTRVDLQGRVHWRRTIPLARIEHFTHGRRHALFGGRSLAEADGERPDYTLATIDLETGAVVSNRLSDLD